MTSLTDHFATLAPHYDAVLSDVWGVIHNGVSAFPAASEALDALPREGRRRVADLERAAAGRAGHPHARPHGGAARGL